MTVYDIVSLNCELLKRLHKNGIKVGDYKWLDLYNDYLQMKAENHKTSYVVAKLSSKYKVCERQVFKVVKKMSSNCSKRAVK